MSARFVNFYTFEKYSLRIRERSMHSQKAGSKIVCLISVRINQHLVIYLSAVNQTRLRSPTCSPM